MAARYRIYRNDMLVGEITYTDVPSENEQALTELFISKGYENYPDDLITYEAVDHAKRKQR